jgi:trehalose 6-phosphate phosphatase
MKHDNSLDPKVREFWRKIMADRPIVAFDFDGTLAPIIHVPNGAFPRSQTLELLKELECHCEIAVITGRSIKNIKQQLRLGKGQRVTFRPNYLIGNHGLEMPWDRPSSELLERAKIWTRIWRKEIRKQMALFPEITWIEFKHYSLTLHIHRGAKNQASEGLKKWLHHTLTQDPAILKKHKVTTKLLPRPNLRLLMGKNVLNILPLDAKYPVLNKGIALHTLMKFRKKKIAIYSGDDTTDEDVFMARPSFGDRVIGVRVGRFAGSRAKFYMSNQEKMDSFLQMLIDVAPLPLPAKPKNRRRPALRPIGK